MHYRPSLRHARMVLGFSGWMDGGDVSTGTVSFLAQELGARRLAEIDPERFYLYNFPGSMELTALFRPHTIIEDGLIAEYQGPANTLYCSEENKLILFEGHEPHLRWGEYADCLLDVASACNVRTIYFIGSVAGAVPHTRLPRFHGSVSEKRLKVLLAEHQIAPSNYEGPASFLTYLTRLCCQRGVEMITLVAEVPAYVQGRNVKCIQAAVAKLSAMLGLAANLRKLDALRAEFERRIDEMIRERAELRDFIRKIEKEYDEETRDTQMDDLKTWFEKQDFPSE